ncbi:unnamed protein product [Durusdinium trenchii]|uniref:Protein YIPF n=1 Tax=Durusdinium trenchii TaxID=1381693 RepID=A0ABP0P964_9DINO
MAYEPTYQSPQFHGGDGMVTPSGSIESQQGRCTLDEPVTETIMRDLRSIGMKLKYVMLPRAREDKGQGLREWDLWGPLVLCLALGIMLSMHAEQASLAFGLVFIIVWVGSGIVTINALLLKGKISFFQERIPGELGHLLPVGVHLPPRGVRLRILHFPLGDRSLLLIDAQRHLAQGDLRDHRLHLGHRRLCEFYVGAFTRGSEGPWRLPGVAFLRGHCLADSDLLSPSPEAAAMERSPADESDRTGVHGGSKPSL